MKTRSLLYGQVLLLTTLMACSGTTQNKLAEDDSAKVETTSDDHHKKTSWGYTGEVGPQYWGTLDEKFQTCSTGKVQSPINISADTEKKVGKLETQYASEDVSVVNNGHTIQVNLSGKDQNMVADGHSFQLLQFHFHTPSENTLMGKSFPLEAHFVHKDAQGTLGVLAVFMEEGNENESLKKIWTNAPKSKSDSPGTVAFDPTTLLPSQLDYFSFAGSLTTPPCSEGVAWHVLETPIQVSTAQIDFFKGLHPMNARPVQQRE